MWRTKSAPFETSFVSNSKMAAFDDVSLKTSLTVGGNTYTCTGTEESGYRWVQDMDTTKGVRGCKVDSLVAACSAIDSCRAPTFAPPQCLRPEPCHYTKDGEMQCFTKDSTNLPKQLDASLTCTDQAITPEFYEKTHEEYMGGLTVYHFKAKTPASTTEESTTTEPTTTESTTPPATDNYVPEFNFAPGSGDTSAKAASDWKQCKWFTGVKTTRACETNSDCPLKDPFGTWFDTVVEKVNVPAKSTVRDFLNSVADDNNVVNLEWSANRPEVTSGGKIRKYMLRSRLQRLHTLDPKFRESVDKMLKQETYLKDAVALKNDGECSTVTKQCRNSSTGPTLAVYDGKENIDFSRNANGDLSYQRKGVSYPIHAWSCDGEGAPSECLAVDALDITGDTPSLQPGTHPVKPTYRVNFTESDTGKVDKYIVSNSVEVKNSDNAAAKTECAATLCSRNANQCPAPHCKLEDSKCVPDDKRIDSVGLSKSF